MKKKKTFKKSTPVYYSMYRSLLSSSGYNLANRSLRILSSNHIWISNDKAIFLYIMNLEAHITYFFI